MLQFASEALVSVPAGTRVEGDPVVAARLPSTGSDVAARLAVHGNRLCFVDLEGEALRAETLEALRGQRVRLRLAAGELGLLRERLGQLRCMHPVFIVAPDAHLVRTINFITAFDIPVHVDASLPPETEDGLDGACQLYLHGPLLRVPVEPFHTLLQTAAQRGGRTLWHTEQEDVRGNYHLTEDGKVTLSARWARRGMFYGSLDDTWPAMLASTLHRGLVELRPRLFRERSPCAFCPHLALCGGYLRALDPEWPCEPWKRAFARMGEGAHYGRTLLEELDRRRIEGDGHGPGA